MVMRVIQVAGTKGKGSTSTYLASIVSKAGYKCGLFVSPHVQEECERISIDGVNISKEDLHRLLDFHKEPRYFRAFFNACIAYFEEQGVEVAVMETGLGGRKDPATELEACESVITTIGMDHMDILGDTIEQIAIEKSMIIRHSGYVIAMPQQKSVMNILESTCDLMNARLVKIEEGDIMIHEDGSFDFLEYVNLRINAIGRMQYIDAATAVNAAKALHHVGVYVDQKSVAEGLAAVQLRARQQYIKEMDVLVDGAHNVDSLIYLDETLRTYFADRKKVLLIASMKDKDVSYFRNIAEREKAEVYICRLNYERAAEAEKLAQLFSGLNINAHVIEDVKEAFAAAHQAARAAGSMLVVAGSIYLAGEVLDILEA